MSAVAAAIGGAAVIGAVSSGISSQNAANAQSQAADRANQLAQTQTDDQIRRAELWREQGLDAANQLQAGMPDLTRKFTLADFQQSPGYQFQLDQGKLAMERSAAASGMLNSEGTQQRLNAYGQGMANTEYQQALQNFTNNQQQRYNMLSGISQQGLQATGMANNASLNYLNTANQNILGQGNAWSASSVAQGNNLANFANTGANQFMNYNMMNKYMDKFGNQNPATSPQILGGGVPLGQGASAGDNIWAGGGQSELYKGLVS